eukprot:TRINITY_DN2722_c0_g1_i17.p1 TRINITY_DN2722_c0_g1~~TRINITY_DN2722_c0_g1_i17.p1  ORF type:complete len:110 (-),score=5.98 TRINITY_DN2722_c0_g1_i17:312-641(-)
MAALLGGTHGAAVKAEVSASTICSYCKLSTKSSIDSRTAHKTSTDTTANTNTVVAVEYNMAALLGGTHGAAVKAEVSATVHAHGGHLLPKYIHQQPTLYPCGHASHPSH